MNRRRFSGMVDALPRVTGQVAYTSNVEVPGQLYAGLLRSVSAHAQIAHLDVTRARSVPGVAAVLTGEDLAHGPRISPYFGPVFRDQPVLALGKVRYVGEPVVAIAAVDRDTAREALDLVEVEYRDLPTVFDAVEALAPGAPLLHEGPRRVASMFADVIVNAGDITSNLCNHFKLRKGDVAQGFAEADFVFEDTFSSPPIAHVPFETHVCVAQVNSGGITVWATTQTPHVLRAQLAEVFGQPLHRVRVIVETLGGAYGAKCYPSIEPIVVALAAAARRPVKLHLSREEEFVTITKHGAQINLKTGVRKDGTLVARQATCHFNTGAYADIGPRLINYGGMGTGGPYFIPHQWVDAYAVYTNLPPAGAFRGYGINQAAWAHETQMDMIAERLGIDPLELRLRNLLVDGQTAATGEVVEDCRWRELLGEAAEAIGWWDNERSSRSGAKVRAKGISVIASRALPLAVSTATARLNPDGTLQILTSSVEMGQGVQSALAILAAETLDLPVEHVRVSGVDTDLTPYEQQTSASRTTQAMGSAVVRAVAEIRAQLLREAADLLEVTEVDLSLEHGRVQVKGAPDRSLEFSHVVRRSRKGNFFGEGRHTLPGGLHPDTGQCQGAGPGWHQAAGAVEVEVDTETGEIDLLRYVAAVYAGRVVNPVLAELQTEGCVTFGVGQALFEEMHFEGGQLQNGNLGDYMVPSLKDLPSKIDLCLLESATPLEIHGLGEPSLPPVMPAVGNAIYRATGIRVVDLPITPEKVLRGLDYAARSASPPSN